MNVDKGRLGEAMLYNQDILVIGIGSDGRIAVFNPACERLSGYNQEEVLGKHFLDFLFSQDNEERLLDLFEHFKTNRLSGSYQFYMPAKDGVEHLVSWTLSTITGPEGEPEMALALGQDITGPQWMRKAISRTEEHFRKLIENTLDLVVILRRDGTVSFISPSVQHLLGYGQSEVINRNIFSYIHPDDVEAGRSSLAIAANRPGVSRYIEIRIRHRDGSWRVYEASSYNLLNSPAVQGLMINCRDITERREAERALKESRRSLSTLMSNLPGMAYRCRNDPGWTIEFTSDGCIALTGYQPSDLIGNHTIAYGDLIHPDDRERIWEEVQRALAQKEPFNLVYRIRTASGEEKWVGEKGRGIFSAEGELLALEGFNTDISDRLRSESLLRLQRDLGVELGGTSDLDTILDTSLEVTLRAAGMDSGGIYMMDEDTGALDLVYHRGISSDFAAKVGHYDAQAPNARLAREGKPVYLEYEGMGLPHVEEWQREGLKAVAINPILSEGKVIGCLLASSHVLVEIPRYSKDALEILAGQIGQAIIRARLVSHLRDSEEKYRLLHDNAGLAIFAFDRDLTLISENRKTVEELGYEEEEVLGRNVLDLGILHPDDYDKALAAIQELLDGAETATVELRLKKKDGSEIIAEITGAPLLDESGELVAVIDIMHDVTDRKLAEEALSRSENRFRSLLENTYDVITLLDADGTILYESPSIENLLGYAPEEVLGRNVFEFVHPDDAPRAIAAFEKGSETPGYTAYMEVRFRHKNGPWRIFGGIGRNLLNDPDVGAIILNSRDITEQREAEEILRRSEERFRLLAENAADLIYRYRLKPDRRFEYVSPSATAITGYTPEEHYEDPDLGLKMVHPDDRHILEDVQQGKTAADTPVVLRWTKKDGSIIWTEQINTPIYDEAGEQVAIEGIARDITDRMQVEQALRRSENRFRSLIENSYDMITLLDETGIIVYQSPSIENLLGYSPEEMVGRNILEFVHPDDFGGPADAYAKGVDIADYTTYIEARMKHKDGSWRLFGGMGRNLLYDPDLRAVVINSRDITEQKEAEEILRESEERYRNIFENATEGIFQLDEGGAFIDANPSFARMLGFASPEELMRETVNAAVQFEMETEQKEAISALLKSRGHIVGFKAKLQRRDGQSIWISLNAHTVRDDDGNILMYEGTAEDITDRERAEEAVRESETRYRTTFDTTGTAMFLIDRDAVISEANREMEKVYGYSREEVVGKMKYMELIMPEDIELVKDYSRKLVSGEIRGPVKLEIRGRHKTGRPIDAIITVNLMRGIDKSVISFMDITEKKASERLQKEKAEQLRDFLDIAAHELRHPATLLKGYAITLNKHWGNMNDEMMRDALSAIELGSDRLVHIVEELLDVSRLQRDRFTVNMGIASAKQQAERALEEMEARKADTKIVLDMEDDASTVWADPERLTRLFIILLDNAVKYSPPGEVVELRGRRRDSKAVFSVLDRGSGVSEEDQGKIFDRFYQVGDVLHHTGPGLGLGLYIAKRIIDAHGGRIWYEPREGGGSVFSFSITSA